MDTKTEIKYKTLSARGIKPLRTDSITFPLNEDRTQKWNVSIYTSYKSIADRLAALIITIILFPFLLLISIGIWLDSPGHPIFAQERVGKNGCKFTAYKFRTMYVNNDDSEYKAYLRRYILKNAPYKVDNNGKRIFKLIDDPRITRTGALLRKTNFDELPQLINIIKGEMLFIGPRPDLPYSVEMYNDWHRKRLQVKPGITGLWQVCHRKGLSFDDMVRLDLEYIKQQSPFLDTRIILKTICTILIGDGS